MSCIGSDFQVFDELYVDCENFVYGGSDKDSDINTLRYKHFCTSKKDTAHLPPTQDELKQHIARANYQAVIWRRSILSSIQPPNPQNHGWKVVDSQLEPVWMLQAPAPDSVLELLSCGCGGDCSTAKCTCRRNRLACTDLCHCSESCENGTTDDANVSDLDDE